MVFKTGVFKRWVFKLVTLQTTIFLNINTKPLELIIHDNPIILDVKIRVPSRRIRNMDCIKLKDTEIRYLRFILKDSEKLRYNLAESTVTLDIKKIGDSTLTINGSTLTISDETNGECYYLYSAALSVGDYYSELEINASGLKNITDTFLIKVIENIEDD